MADGRHLEKLKNHHIKRKIAISRPRFGQFRPNSARRRSSTLLSRPIVKFFKIKDGGGRHREKVEISPYLGDGWSYRLEIWHADTVPTLLTIPFRLVYALDVACSFSETFTVQNDKRAYINLAIKQQIYMLKNCSLCTLLTAMDQKPLKS